MIPTSLAAFVSFLLLLAPGALWQLQQSRHEPAVKETALAEILRVVIASLVATSVAALALMPWVWLPLYQLAESAGSHAFDSPTSAVPYIGGAVATSLLACGGTMVVAALKWPGRAPINPGRQWNHVFVTMKPPEADPPYLTVELLDETVWKGELVSFDTDPEDHNRGLTLGPPLRRRRREEKAFEKRDSAEMWSAVILAEPQIKSIQVRYPTPIKD